MVHIHTSILQCAYVVYVYIARYLLLWIWNLWCWLGVGITFFDLKWFYLIFKIHRSKSHMAPKWNCKRPSSWQHSEDQRRYDSNGKRSSPKRMWLDLSAGQQVRLTPGHNIQGAQQPQYMHIGAKKAITIKGETRQPGVGIGRVVSRCDKSCSFVLQIEGVQMRLGIWWLESAMRGGIDVLPLVNKEPTFET